MLLQHLLVATKHRIAAREALSNAWTDMSTDSECMGQERRPAWYSVEKTNLQERKRRRTCLTTGLDAQEKKEISYPCQASKHDFPDKSTA
jgi:hypothetical protein